MKSWKWLLFCGPLLAVLSGAEDRLALDFQKPPPAARPWVYWFWLNGNITSNGITADLEAMKRVGIGGGLIMEVDQGAPVGPADFMSQRWRDLFKHVDSEARRLGLEVNMNNDAGWNGSGGPWITPEQSMQQVVWTETNLTGPQHFADKLAQPEATAGFYRDIEVQAFPAVGHYRIPNIETKAAFQKHGQHSPSQGDLGPDSVLQRHALTNLAAQMDASGKLIWDVPPGKWTVVRFGHTSTGIENAPAPKSGRGLECDKLSKKGIEANFAGMMAKLAADNGLKPGKQKLGLVATHIDSWENGTQNWTAQMREEFQRRRGYDLLPFLPVMTGRVVGSLEISERFLWDLRQTISELVIENYAGHFHHLANAAGMRFTVEAYGSPCDAISYAGQSDEPMGEFWTPSGAIETCKAMASAGHIYGQRIIGAESFTSGDQEKWREHPATLKALGDQAFCEGINRFVFHRYAMQPWVPEYRPGMTMGPWGQHYERTETWWDWSPAWHEYLARCQFMLRQGLFVADICYVQPEAPAQGPGDHKRGGYAWDECTAHEVITRMSVKDGRIVLPDGMSYRVLVLPWSQTMTPGLLRKVKELVQAGATVLGPKPSASPSLSGFPQCDAEVKQLAAELWGDANGTSVKEHHFSSGRLVWSDLPEKVLAKSGVPDDFSSGQPLRFIHRRSGDRDIYFVANSQPFEFATTCSFRITGRVPELWWPDSGRIERATIWQEKQGLTQVVLPLGPSGSVFVVFQNSAQKQDSLVLLERDGKPILSAEPEPRLKITVVKARYGVLDDATRTRDVTQKIRGKVDDGEFAFPASTMAQGDDPASGVEKTLMVDYTIEGKRFTVRARDPNTIHLSREALNVKVEKARYGVLDDPKRTRDVREKLQRLLDTGASSFGVAQMAEGDDPAFLVVKTLDLEYTLNGKTEHVTGTDPETIRLSPSAIPPRPVAEVHRDAKGKLMLETREPGGYEFMTTTGCRGRVTVKDAALSLEVSGPWQVRFAPNRGAPAEVTFGKLISWSDSDEPGVKYFSGEATYSKTLAVPRAMLAKGKKLYLDLGKVAVMARVKLNGRDLGALWKPPFCADITSMAKPGDNRLEVQVVNLWPNRMIGDEQLPEDSDRNPNGTLKAWPQWLLEGKPSPTGRYTFTSWRLWKKKDALLESGLIGPVQLVTVPIIPLKP